jgi:hypothetical protein
MAAQGTHILQTTTSAATTGNSRLIMNTLGGDFTLPPFAGRNPSSA